MRDVLLDMHIAFLTCKGRGREKGAAGFSPAAPQYMDQRSDIRCRKLLRASRLASLNFLKQQEVSDPSSERNCPIL
jgi:hypothetical protein